MLMLDNGMSICYHTDTAADWRTPDGASTSRQEEERNGRKHERKRA
jgi:hypothetical protein